MVCLVALQAYKTENTELSKVLKDVMSQVKRIESGLPPKSGTAKVAHGSSKLTSTALEELLALWHSRHGDDSSRGALVVQLRAQVEQLVGKSAQLQEQLTSTQAAHESLTMQLARKDMQVKGFQYSSQTTILGTRKKDCISRRIEHFWLSFQF